VDGFFLIMGASVRIADLVRQTVDLSGLALKDEANLNGDIEITVTGLRPGEKLLPEKMLCRWPLCWANGVKNLGCW
jgi:FlaA1/EpsC-like NDP-sugar epimerase